jgi:hypothetical protein
MPIHDWTRVEAGDFHHFHQTWIPLLAAALNSGGLPPGFMALAEQVTGRPIPDVVTLQSRSPMGGVAVAPAPAPFARVIQKFERINYAKRADRVVIRHGRGRVVAIIESGISRGGRPTARHSAVPDRVRLRAVPARRDLRRSVAGIPGHAQGSGGIGSLSRGGGRSSGTSGTGQGAPHPARLAS